MNSRLTAPPPSVEHAREVVQRVGVVLGAKRCFLFNDAFHFTLSDGWTVALSPESAGRFRLDACHRGRPVDTFWALAWDEARIVGLILELRRELVVRAAA